MSYWADRVGLVATEQARQAAFGGVPALPDAAPRTPRERLLVAIVLGAQGRYAAATTILDELRHGPDRVLASLALSTYASHRRQLGGHAAALGPDGAALRLVTDIEGDEDPDGLDADGARTDALLGIAADNLGVGRLPVARRVLARAEPRSWRTRVRKGWVTAEIALAAGDAAAARQPAETALERATAAGALRHVTKSQLVLAAVLGALGDRERAMHLVTEALGVSGKFALRSLSWPAGLLSAEHRVDVRDGARHTAVAVLHAVLLRSDPEGRRLAHESPWVPV